MDATLLDQPFSPGAVFASPAQRILALGFYDGPTEGLLQCETGRVYHFKILAWDQESQDVRVFGLAPMPPGAFDRLTELFAQHEEPRWPFWVPSGSEVQKGTLDAILKEGDPVDWVIATDENGTIMAAKRALPSDIRAVADWRLFLGLGSETPVLSNRP
jgi:hypothetical protein